MLQTAHDSRLELTVRSLVLGAAITLVFTAANVYLGLKVGLTFASSIPAAVISMAVLRAFKSGTIYENNIVQTVASAAGTLSAVIFVLPGLVMVGWWSGFPFWPAFGICVVGGTLGVMFTIPLRRALVTTSDLPYPEGVAAAEVLRVGTGTREGAAEGKAGVLAVLWGAIASAAFAAVAATRIFAGEIEYYFRAGASASGIGFSLSLALLGAGHLIGLAVGLAIFTGFVLAWGIGVPLLTAMHPASGAAVDVATNVWQHQVRFIGAGAIGISAIWSLLRLAAPVWNGLISSIESSRRRAAGEGHLLPRTEQDLPIGIVAAISVACMIPMAVLLGIFLRGGAIANYIVPLTIAAVVYVFVVGFVVAAVAGYMAGLIGASNSPISGLAILAVLGISLTVLVIAHGASGAAKDALVAFALFVTAIVLASATIANDNLQDLKTGQLVDATPWRQQVALIAGVFFGSLVIPPVLTLLQAAYGFAGAPHPHPAAAAQPLPAPQATLISALARGVVSGNIDWSLIFIGAGVGAVIIIIDEVLRRQTAERAKLPPLAVGLGIYLPMSTTAAAVVGAVFGWVYNRSVAHRTYGDIAKRLGVLLASGLIVGESLFGVLLSGIIVADKGNGTPLSLVGDNFLLPSEIIGGLAFFALAVFLYRWVGKLAATVT
ncbi:MAG TPA: oligopeptide transporter, OPT family [Candidatus Baltobacteraceae bacterium]|jgi:putative OPT family oligopeptide transporter|nr:oligopeptide transporter, OPT family [Candidatus Baltobacteraceae bacterium]